MWTWKEISDGWLTGSSIARTEAECVAAFDRVEQVLGRDWIDGVRQDGETGSAPTLSVVTVGEELASLAGVKNPELLIPKLQAGRRDAFAELAAIHLIRRAETHIAVELEPQVATGKRPDFRIRTGDAPWTYVEVTQTRESEAYVSLIAIANKLSNTVFPGAKGLRFTLELFLLREPTEAEAEALAGRIPEFAGTLSGTVDLPDDLGRVFINDAAPGRLELKDRGVGSDEPRVGVMQVEGENGQATRQIAVRIPFTDTRASQFVEAEARQLPKDAPTLIVVDLAGAPGAFRKWEPLIRRRLQPTIHTRIGGVVLLRGGYFTSDRGATAQLDVNPIWNPHARHQLPDWLVDRIATAALIQFP
jgi:hypothetical protein